MVNKKKKVTFADEAKNILSKYKFYLGKDFDQYDPLSLNSLEKEMDSLRQNQESVKESNKMYNNQYGKGGEILKSTVSTSHFVDITPTTFRLEAIRKNIIPKDMDTSDINKVEKYLNNYVKDNNLSEYQIPYRIANGKIQKNYGRTKGRDYVKKLNINEPLIDEGNREEFLKKNGGYIKDKFPQISPLNINFDFINDSLESPDSNDKIEILNKLKKAGLVTRKRGGMLPSYQGGGGFKDYSNKFLEGFLPQAFLGPVGGTFYNMGKKKIGNYLDKYSNIGEYADLSNLRIEPQDIAATIDPSDYNVASESIRSQSYIPETINLASEREEAKRRGNVSRSILRRQAGSSGSQAAAFAQSLAGEQAINRNTNDAVNRSLLQEQQTNIAAANRAGEINTAAANRAAEINAMNSLRAAQATQRGKMFADQANLGIEQFNVSNDLQAMGDYYNRLQQQEMFNRDLDIYRDASRLGATNQLINTGASLFGNAAQAAPAALTLLGGSDIKFKKNVVFLKSIKGINIYSYEYKSKYKSPGIYIGVLANEVEKKIPNSVVEINGYKYVDYKKVSEYLK